VRLSRLTLYHFRNLGVQELEFPPEGVAIVGPNAHGKTNLLEAIYYLETFRSFRAARDEQLTAFGQPVFRVAGRFAGEGEAVEVTAAFQRAGPRKKVTIDGHEPDRLGDALGRTAAVVFAPSDVKVIAGGPAERRRFLDIVLSLASPGYLRALQQYRLVLAQRNAALKARSDRAAVAAWDEPLTSLGAKVMSARRGWIAASAETFRTCYREISGGRSAQMSYQPSVGGAADAEQEDLPERFAHALSRTRSNERRLATTVVGPHRDEMGISVAADSGDLDLRTFGSGGQQRTGALSLRLTEAATVREVRGRTPILLLDDVFSELDEGRSRRILELIEENLRHQVILTAPRETDVQVRRESIPRWRVENGVVST
jgi:DNA replication and repair protein RecF